MIFPPFFTRPKYPWFFRQGPQGGSTRSSNINDLFIFFFRLIRNSWSASHMTIFVVVRFFSRSTVKPIHFIIQAGHIQRYGSDATSTPHSDGWFLVMLTQLYDAYMLAHLWCVQADAHMLSLTDPYPEYRLHMNAHHRWLGYGVYESLVVGYFWCFI